MSCCAPIHRSPLVLLIGLVLVTVGVCAAQEAAPPPPSEAEIPKAEAPESDAAKKVASDNSTAQETPAKKEGLVTETPFWIKDIKEDLIFDYVPVLTEPCETYEEAKSKIDSALEKAFANHLNKRLGDLRLAEQLTPPVKVLRDKYTSTSPWAIINTNIEGKEQFQGVTRMDIFDSEISVLISDHFRKQHQLSAIQKTGFIGAGMLGLVFILAVSARLDHAFGGKRSGILRAASTVAILSLFVGLFITAVLGRVFTS